MDATVDFVDSTDLLDDPEDLRARAREQGYLFFRGLLPAADVLGVRRRVLEVIADHGWLASGSDLMDGMADRGAYSAIPAQDRGFCGGGITAEAYRDVQHLREFQALAHHPRLVGAYEALFGRRVLPHPRNIARIVIPSDETVATPPHQDFIHIQGTKDVWTAWFPLGDCPIELGGLSVLVGSHHEGLMSYKAVGGAGGLEAYLCDLDYPWAVGDFRLGDVITFSSQTVHRSLPHRAGDRIRLSCDYRYQPADEPIDRSSLEVHCAVDTWESIYSDWDDTSLAYYWRNQNLRLSDWDERIRWQKDKIC